MIIQTTEELKLYLPTLTAAFNFANMSPIIELQSQPRLIKNILGKDTWDILQQYYDSLPEAGNGSSAASSAGGPGSVVLAELLKLCQNYLANEAGFRAVAPN